MRKILPFILATITQHPRQIVEAGVDFQWKKDLWSYNLFRFYELLLGRKIEVRFESAMNLLTGEMLFGTLESRVVHNEVMLRKFLAVLSFPRLKIVRVPMQLPAFAFAGLSNRGKSMVLYAIAFDTGSTNTPSTGASPYTYSYTVTGSNPAILAGDCTNTGSSVVSAVSYNSVALTKQAHIKFAGNTLYQDLWYLTACATGSNTLSFTFTSTLIYGTAASFSGVATSIDGSTTSAPGTTTSVSTSITSTVDNGRQVGFMNKANAANASAGTATTRVFNVDSAFGYFWNTNAVSPAGSNTIQATGGSDDWAATSIMLSPYATPSGPTNVKTVNGLALR